MYVKERKKSFGFLDEFSSKTRVTRFFWKLAVCHLAKQGKKETKVVPFKLYTKGNLKDFLVEFSSKTRVCIFLAVHLLSIPFLLEKEVIQPHFPVRLPCYDFTPLTRRTLDSVLLAVRLPASGTPHSDGVTGGVYKARERIHRIMLICDY